MVSIQNPSNFNPLISNAINLHSEIAWTGFKIDYCESTDDTGSPVYVPPDIQLMITRDLMKGLGVTIGSGTIGLGQN